MDIDAIVKYFGFSEHPFISNPDPRFLYFSSQVKEALAKCEFMARDRIGPIYMYGPIGSGKTFLYNLRVVFVSLARKHPFACASGFNQLSLTRK